MKSILLCVCLTLCLAGLCAAREDKKKAETKPHPDLSGTWTLDKSKSDFGPFQNRPIAKADATLVVAHHDPELKMTRTLSLNGQQQTQETTYYTDERGETNPATMGGGEVKSKTKWDGDRVVAHATIKREGPRGPSEIDLVEHWQVSGDGKTLTHSTTISGQFGAQEIKLVYRRGA
ncbi:MAG: hypothetical protein QOJ76_3340 [Acidobacteriota bacterium]|nr:hypothetical protein [Acidobacteriota bacterium]